MIASLINHLLQICSTPQQLIHQSMTCMSHDTSSDLHLNTAATAASICSSFHVQLHSLQYPLDSLPPLIHSLLHFIVFPLYEGFSTDHYQSLHLWESSAVLRFLALALAGLLLCAFSALIWMHRKQQHGSRDPKTWPILGSQLEVSRNYDRLLDWTTSFFSDDHRTVKMSFLSRHSYYTVDPANVEYILKTNFQNYPKGQESHHRLYDLLGNGILNTDGSTWKMHRKLGSLEFSIKKLRHLSSTVYKRNAMKLVEALANSTLHGVDVQDLLLDMTFHSICEVVFGSDFDASSINKAGDEAKSIADSLDNAQEMLALRYIHPWWRIQRFFNVGSERVFREDITNFNRFLENVIEKRRLQMRKEGHERSSCNGQLVQDADSNVNTSNTHGAEDLLSRFLLHEDQEGINMEMVRDAMLSFVFAGRDTTASTLSWFLYCMCINPDKQEQVYRELLKLESEAAAHEPIKTSDHVDRINRETIGAMQSLEIKSRQMREFAEKVLDYESLQSSSMPYLHSALAETLRLYPAVPRDGKVTLKDDTLPDGTHLQAGDQVAYIPYAMGRMPFLWGPDALDFRPERWLHNGTFQPESPFKFTAFQAGPRMCLGKDAAYLQMKITAALLIRFFHFKLTPNHPVEYRMMNVMTMKHGLRVNVISR